MVNTSGRERSEPEHIFKRKYRLCVMDSSGLYRRTELRVYATYEEHRSIIEYIVRRRKLLNEAELRELLALTDADHIDYDEVI